MAQWTSSCVIYIHTDGGRTHDLCIVNHNLTDMAIDIFTKRYVEEKGKRPLVEDFFHARPAQGDEALPSLDGFWAADPLGWRRQ